MPSIHRVKNSNNWHCAFILPDGRRALRTTGTANKTKAMEICLKMAETSRLGRQGVLTESRAREVIADIYAIANRENMPTATATDFLDQWLQLKSLKVTDSSMQEYTNASTLLKNHLGSKAERPIDAITARDISSFRNSLAARVAGSTANKLLKILRGAWAQAARDGLVRENVFLRVDLVKAQKAERRAFTLEEIKRILAEANEEWRGMVLLGFYTGQRLGDIAALTWQNVDLEKKEIRLVTRKTHRRMVIPSPPPLQRYLMSLSAPDYPDIPLFPRAATKGVNALSREFAELLAEIGLREKRTHQGIGIGRASRRKVGGLSFHCLRHTTTSALKNAGVNNAVAMELIGHDSEAISRAYTHIEEAALRKAVKKLPDLFD
jgi:integrase